MKSIKEIKETMKTKSRYMELKDREDHTHTQRAHTHTHVVSKLSLLQAKWTTLCSIGDMGGGGSKQKKREGKR